MQRNLRLFKLSVCEMIGTFFLVLVGCGSIILSQLHLISDGSLAIPAAFGGIVMIMIYALGHLSGAHFNPAVTIGFMFSRAFPFKKGMAYIAAQLIGAMLASSVHMLLFKGQIHDFGMTRAILTFPLALLVEIILSFLLMFVIISVATDTKACSNMAGLAIGATVMIAALVGGPLTGASMNPARSIAPAIVAGELDMLYLYIVGPLVGAILGALSYKWVSCSLQSCKGKKDSSAC